MGMLGARLHGLLLKLADNNALEDDIAVLGGTGAPTSGTYGGKILESGQPAVFLQGDAPTADGMLSVTPDGGTTIRQVALAPSSTRYELHWQAGARGKPGINADIQNASEAVRMVADPDFEVTGTNSTSALSTRNAEGGILFTTAGADGDEMILTPHLDTNQSAWTGVTWGTDKATVWECTIRTGAAITNCIIWAGLKLTSTEVTATDDDQAFFRYEDGVNDGEWEAITSVGGTDDEHDTGVVVAVDTTVRLKIVIDGTTRVPTYYIDDVLVETGSALTDATDLIPYIGVAADGAAEAKTLILLTQDIGRTIG